MSNKRIDLTQFEGHTEGPWKAGIDCPEYFEMGEAHEENFHFSLHEFHAVIPGTDAWRGARDGEWGNPNEWHGYSERNPKQLRADVLLMAAGPDLIAELKRCYEREDRIIRALKGTWIGSTCWHQPSEHLEDIAETRGSTLGHIASLLQVDVNRQDIHDLEYGCGGENCDHNASE
tara:strand:- start:106 stop:630 length:525 start_codon:yes stop_codon:yes gene_type:complete